MLPQKLSRGLRWRLLSLSSRIRTVWFSTPALAQGHPRVRTVAYYGRPASLPLCTKGYSMDKSISTTPLRQVPCLTQDRLESLTASCRAKQIAMVDPQSHGRVRTQDATRSPGHPKILSPWAHRRPKTKAGPILCGPQKAPRGIPQILLPHAGIVDCSP